MTMKLELSISIVLQHDCPRIESSMRRLRLELIDLYQYHTPDPNVPVEESLGELVRLRDEGKIREIGVSNFTVDQLKRSRAVAPIVSVQNRYSLDFRKFEDVLRSARPNISRSCLGGRSPSSDRASSRSRNPRPSRSPRSTRSARNRLRLHGCWRAQRRCCPFSAPRGGRISRTISRERCCA